MSSPEFDAEPFNCSPEIEDAREASSDDTEVLLADVASLVGNKAAFDCTSTGWAMSFEAIHPPKDTIRLSFALMGEAANDDQENGNVSTPNILATINVVSKGLGGRSINDNYRIFSYVDQRNRAKFITKRHTGFTKSSDDFTPQTLAAILDSGKWQADNKLDTVSPRECERLAGLFASAKSVREEL